MADANKKAVTKEELFVIFNDYGLIDVQIANGTWGNVQFKKVVNTKTTRLGDRYKVEVDYICTFLQDAGGKSNGPLIMPVTVVAFKSLSIIPTPLTTGQTFSVTLNLSQESSDGNMIENTTMTVNHSIKTDENGYNYLEFKCNPASVSEGYYAGTVISWSGVVEIPF